MALITTKYKLLLIACLLVLNCRFQNMVSGTNDNIVDTFSFICTSKFNGVVHVELLLEGMIEIIEPTMGTF